MEQPYKYYNVDVIGYAILEDHVVGDTIYFEDKNGHIVSGVVKQVNDRSCHDIFINCQIDYKEYVVNVYDDVDTIVNSWECVDGN